MKNREFGSDFSFLADVYTSKSEDNILSEIPASTCYFSGRSALFSLLESGIVEYGWKNIFIPEYYCHEVTEFIEATSIKIQFYDFGPYSPELNLDGFDQEGNVLLLVNYFGRKNLLDHQFSKCHTIEDHTHSLLSFEYILNSKADYCFASMRKTLPLPAGGILWSPKGLNLPNDPKQEILAEKISYMKLSAMLLKTQYLNGENIPKSNFRDLFGFSEDLFSKHESNGKLPDLIEQMARNISATRLREERASNVRQIADLIVNKELILYPDEDDLMEAMGLVLIFKDFDVREKMRVYLIENSIFPAVLWPDQVAAQAQDFSNRMLFIHCDFRYTGNDMNYIGQIINKF